jgi:hypothetical protein
VQLELLSVDAASGFTSFFSPSGKPPIWELDVYTNLQDSDQQFAKDGERFRAPWVPQAIGGRIKKGVKKPSGKRSKIIQAAIGSPTSAAGTPQAAGSPMQAGSPMFMHTPNGALSPQPTASPSAASLGSPANHAARFPSTSHGSSLSSESKHRFLQYFSEAYNPRTHTSFDEELKKPFESAVNVVLPQGVMDGVYEETASSSASADKNAGHPQSSVAGPASSRSSPSPPPPALPPRPASSGSAVAAAQASSAPLLNSTVAANAAAAASTASAGPLSSITESDDDDDAPVLVRPPSGGASSDSASTAKVNPVKKGFGRLFSSAKASFSAALHQAGAHTGAVASAGMGVLQQSKGPSSQQQSLQAQPHQKKTLQGAVAPLALPVSPTGSSSASASTSSSSGVTSFAMLLNQQPSNQSSSELNLNTPVATSMAGSTTSSSSGDLAYPTSFVAPSTSSAQYTGWSPRVTQKKVVPFSLPRLSGGGLSPTKRSGSSAGEEEHQGGMTLVKTTSEERLAVHPDYLHTPAQDAHALARYTEYIDTSRLYAAEPLAMAVPLREFETISAAEKSALVARGLARAASTKQQQDDSELSEQALLAASLKMGHHQLVDLLVSNLHDLRELHDQVVLHEAVSLSSALEERPVYLAATPLPPPSLPPQVDAATRRAETDARMKGFIDAAK